MLQHWTASIVFPKRIIAMRIPALVEFPMGIFSKDIKALNDLFVGGAGAGSGSFKN